MDRMHGEASKVSYSLREVDSPCCIDGDREGTARLASNRRTVSGRTDKSKCLLDIKELYSTFNLMAQGISTHNRYSVLQCALSGALLGLLLPILFVLSKFAAITDGTDFGLHAAGHLHDQSPWVYIVYLAPLMLGTLFGVFALVSNGRLQSAWDRQQDLVGAEAESSRQILETLDDGFLTLSCDGTIRYANSAAAIMFGYQHGELEGENIARLLYEPHSGLFTEFLETRPRVQEAFKGSGDTRGVALGAPKHGIDVAAVHRDGHRFPINVKLGTALNAKTNCPLYSGLIRDVTAEGTLHRTSANLTAELTQFIDTANAPIFGINVGGQVNEWNQQAANITGFSKEEVMGRDLVGEFITDDYKASVHDVLLAALRGAETANYEFPLFTKDKRRIDVLLNATTRRDIDGNIVGVIGVGQDITELREKNIALQQAQKMEVVGQLTGGIAHDFNNLLTVISGNLRLLRADLPKHDSDTAEMLDDAIAAAEDGAELTERLLGFSRTRVLTPVPTNVAESIERSVRLLARTLGENIALETVFASDTLQIHIDRVQFENALLNLALNSRDAMPDGGKIEISTSHYLQTNDDSLSIGLTPGPYVRIVIRDTGTGIPPDQLQRIFEPFFTTKDGHGSGLGLSMVYGFTQQSGGTCLVDQSTPRGTAISLFFPYSDTHSSTTDGAELRNSYHTEDGKVVLLAEDEARVRKLTARDLKNLGYSVVEAENAAAAREILESGQIVDLLLSDVLMPGDMDGFQLAEWTHQNHPTTKVLLLSGYTKRQPSQTEREQFPLLKKPYDFEVLAERLHDMLSSTKVGTDSQVDPGILGLGHPRIEHR